MVRERKKNAELKKQISSAYTQRGANMCMEDLVAELNELQKCFDKSEQIRKQQKTIITRMK